MALEVGGRSSAPGMALTWDKAEQKIGWNAELRPREDREGHFRCWEAKSKLRGQIVSTWHSGLLKEESGKDLAELSLNARMRAWKVTLRVCLRLPYCHRPPFSSGAPCRKSDHSFSARRGLAGSVEIFPGTLEVRLVWSSPVLRWAARTEEFLRGR
jgi:hypothetical protein